MIEGCGSNGCEYMTGGVVAILGGVGANFGAGMTGGMAYLYDPEGAAGNRLNLETLVTCPVSADHWERQLLALIERHAEETRSRKARDLLRNWTAKKGSFLQVCPKEMLNKLEHPLAEDDRAVSA